MLTGAEREIDQMSQVPKTSFAMVQTDVRSLQPMDLPIPDIDEDSAILQVEACGICGSDVEQYAGVIDVPKPLIPGHEPLGRIVKTGDRAARRWGVEVGDRVAVETMLSCRFCSCCLDGHYHLCRKRKIYAYVPLSEKPGLWGAYSQYMYLHPNSILHKMDPHLAPELAVMFNPLGAGFRWAVELPQIRPGESLVILGPGQRGLASVIAARQAGAGLIIVTGLADDARKLALAKSFGAHHTVDVDNEPAVRRVRELTGEGADVVLDVSAFATGPVSDALKMVRPGGRIVLAGVKGMKPVERFISDYIVMKEIKIQGAMGVTSSGYQKAIQLLEAGTSPIAEMHTHNFALEEADLAVRTLGREVAGDESIHSCLIPPV